MDKDKQIEARERLWSDAFDAVNRLFAVYNSTATEVFEYDFIKLSQLTNALAGVENVIKTP